jgi:Glucose dehydrogenase
MGETYPAQADRVPVLAVALLYSTAAVLGIVGLAMLAGGFALARLGGSLYYLVAGGAIVVSAVFMLRRHVLGLWLYWATVGGSIVWAVWEVGFHAWLLLPRVLVLTLFGLWLLLPWTSPLFEGNIGRRSTAPKGLGGRAHRRPCRYSPPCRRRPREQCRSAVPGWTGCIPGGFAGCTRDRRRPGRLAILGA